MFLVKNYLWYTNRYTTGFIEGRGSGAKSRAESIQVDSVDSVNIVDDVAGVDGMAWMV